MMPIRTWVLCHSFAALLFFAGNAETRAGMVVSNLICDLGTGVRPYVSEDLSYARTAYAPDLPNKRIIFYPRVAAGLPDPVARMDFALACLTVLEQQSDACKAIIYLRDRNLIRSHDLKVLEDHFLSVSKQDSQAFEKIKMVYACY